MPLRDIKLDGSARFCFQVIAVLGHRNDCCGNEKKSTEAEFWESMDQLETISAEKLLSYGVYLRNTMRKLYHSE